MHISFFITYILHCIDCIILTIFQQTNFSSVYNQMDIQILFFILICYVIHFCTKCLGFSTPCCKKTYCYQVIFKEATESRFQIASNAILILFKTEILFKIYIFPKFWHSFLGLLEIFYIFNYCC